MNKLNVKKFATASGITGAIIYLSCFVLMSILPKSTLVKLGNLIFHGVDFTNDLRMGIPIMETILGIAVSFVLWGLIGFIFSSVYNKILSNESTE